MKKKKKLLLLLVSIGIITYSCQRDNDPIHLQNSSILHRAQEDPEKPDRIIIPGKKLENPYSIQNMRKAYLNLQSKNTSNLTPKGEADIQTTDYYVRFLPASDAEKLTLQDADGLTLFDMPLDHDVEEGVAGAYHDPSIPVDQITWQYTVVPVDYKFRSITYEILEHLFLQDDDDSSGKRIERNAIHKNFWVELENEALRITGNENAINEKSNFSAKSNWNPSGTLTYEDNTTSPTQIIPLSGVRVIVKRWFKWKRAITDTNGYFQVGKFKSDKVKCAIKWERADWDIRNGSYGQAWYSFETLKKGNRWDKIIKKSNTPLNWLFASVHRGAMEYFYNYSTYRIRKPFDKDNFISSKLHLGAKNKSGRSHYFKFNKIIWAAPVVIYSNNKNSRALFTTTIHELAHVSHWEIGYSTAQFVIDALADDPFLPESWATGVEYTVINKVYPKSYFTTDVDINFPYNYNLQYQTLEYIQSSSRGYTPIVIDLIDKNNQSISWSSSRPNDRVSGYSLGQLEDALPGSFGSWWSWKSNIRKMYKNPTEGEALDYLFREYH